MKINTRFWEKGKNIQDESITSFNKLKSEFGKLSYLEKLKNLETKNLNVGKYYPIRKVIIRDVGHLSLSREEQTKWVKKNSFSIIPQTIKEYTDGLEWFRSYHQNRLEEFVIEDSEKLKKEFQSFINPFKNSEIRKSNIKEQINTYKTNREKLSPYKDLKMGEHLTSTVLDREVTLTTEDEEFYVDYHSCNKMIEYLSEQLNELEGGATTKKGNSNKIEYDLTEKMLILSFLQDKKELPKHNPAKGETKVQFEKIYSLLLNAKEDSVKQAFQTALKIKENRELTSGNARFRLAQLGKIKTLFIEIKHSPIVSEIEGLENLIRLKHR